MCEVYDREFFDKLTYIICKSGGATADLSGDPLSARSAGEKTQVDTKSLLTNQNFEFHLHKNTTHLKRNIFFLTCNV